MWVGRWVVGECVGFVCGRKRGGHICIGPVYMCDKKNYTVANHLFVSHTIVCFISQVALRWVTQQGIVVGLAKQCLWYKGIDDVVWTWGERVVCLMVSILSVCHSCLVPLASAVPLF